MSQEEKQIWECIIHFLHKHESLCLQGIGCFRAEEESCLVDPVAKLVYPAKRIIQFESCDEPTTPAFGPFLKRLLGKEDINLEKNLNGFAELFHLALKDRSRLEIEGLGSFRNNVVGITEFEPMPGNPFFDASFGLKPIHFAANLVRTKRITVEQVNEEDPELTEMRESALKELKVMLDHARIAEASKERKSTKLFPLVATTLVLILLANLGIFLFNGPVDQLKDQLVKMNLLGKTGELIDSQHIVVPELTAPEPILDMPVENTVSELVSDSIVLHIGSVYRRGFIDFDSLIYGSNPPSVDPTQVTNSLPVENIDEIKVEEKVIVNDVVLPRIESVDAIEKGVESGFYVIAGAFRIEANARRLTAQLQKDGDVSARMFKPKNHRYFLVAYGKGHTMNQAMNLLEKKQQNCPDVWVYSAY